MKSQRRFVKMFKPQFAAKVRAGTKRQTIRPIPKRMPSEGNTIDCRQWEGLPYRSKHIKIGEFTISKVRFVTVSTRMVSFKETESGDEWATGVGFHLERFAQADGFGSWEEMVDWFRREHGELPFKGLLIGWDWKKEL